ncbi:MAG TPA: hypothetical protein VHM92_10960 [Allosphingosinicella sp.]|nr:hypothetical protein [Allosphingosinicella sp.]
MINHGRLGALLALAALAAPAGAASSKAAYSVRNDVGRRIDCLVRVGGSSQTERLVIRTGATWTGRFSAKKGIRMRCEGEFSTWSRLSPGAAYMAVEGRKGLIQIRRAS